METKKQTAVSIIIKNFNLLSDNDFKTWFLNSMDKLEAMEKEQMIEFAEFVATYSDKNKNAYKEMLHAKSKYDGTERTIDLLEQYYKL